MNNIEVNTTIPGFTTKFSLEILGYLSKNVPSTKTIVEIGVLWGRGTYPIVKNKQDDVKVICIDPCFVAKRGTIKRYNGYYDFKQDEELEIYKNYLKEVPDNLYLEKILQKNNLLNNVEFHQEISDNIIFDSSVNLAIVDGDHGNNKPIFDMLKFINYSDCLIVMDDYNKIFFPDVVTAVDIAIKKFKRNVVYLYEDTNSPENLDNRVYILPNSGPMLKPMTHLIDRFKSIMLKPNFNF